MQTWKTFYRTASGLCAIVGLTLSLTACETPATFNPQFSVRLAAERPGASVTGATTFKGKTYYLEAQPVVAATDLESVTSGPDLLGSGWSVDFRFKRTAAQRIGHTTQKSLGRTMCLTLGDEILLVAILQGPFSDRMQTSGIASKEAAELLVKRITQTQG